MAVNLRELCDDARDFWNWGPWLVADLTNEYEDMHVVPFFYRDNPEIVALASPDLVRSALDMDLTANSNLDHFLKMRAAKAGVFNLSKNAYGD